MLCHGHRHSYVKTWYLHCLKYVYEKVYTWQELVGSTRDWIWGLSGSETILITTCLCRSFWRKSHIWQKWTWVIYINNVLSIKTILFDILGFWCQLEEIRFVKTLSKRRMFVSSMKISACWLLHRLIKFYKICWEKRPAKPQPNLQTSFYRRDLKNTQPHLKVSHVLLCLWLVPSHLMCLVWTRNRSIAPNANADNMRTASMLLVSW